VIFITLGVYRVVLASDDIFNLKIFFSFITAQKRVSATPTALERGQNAESQLYTDRPFYIYRHFIHLNFGISSDRFPKKSPTIILVTTIRVTLLDI